MDVQWESEVAGLLTDLSAAQDELLEVLKEKCRLLVGGDVEGLEGVNGRELALVDRLQEIHARREGLLALARERGLPAESIRVLASSLAPAERDPLMSRMQQAAGRWRLLQHQSLTNWVLAQRSLIHLSQILEIIATGGRRQPTYRNSHAQAVEASGGLVDHAA